ncbi:hypothetical protein BKA62DRAFT_668067 [Auriculariales sp. MPI-PUGE-AT-0066]|nr:hypothetical protein BKA62DRAFT_668067 [Auriculariales sp. MPI-PUGE-AT-0066]
MCTAVIALQSIILPPSRPISRFTSASVVNLAMLREIAAHELVDTSPPAYTQSAAPPPYIEQDVTSAEPFTVARLLFCYGFIFPMFWFAGAFILAMPLKAPAAWEESKTEEERTMLFKVLRATEVKWGKRCLYASLGFTLLLVTVLAHIFATHH